MVRHQHKLEKEKKELKEKKYKEFLTKFLYDIFELDVNQCSISEHTRLSDFSVKYPYDGNYNLSINDVLNTDINNLEKVNSLYKVKLTTTNIQLKTIFDIIEANKND